jgi:hypothetical protein
LGTNYFTADEDEVKEIDVDIAIVLSRTLNLNIIAQSVCIIILFVLPASVLNRPWYIGLGATKMCITPCKM